MALISTTYNVDAKRTTIDRSTATNVNMDENIYTLIELGIDFFLHTEVCLFS